MPKILGCSFEVFGIVQGVSFRMYTERQANELNIRGWCANTRDDTVKGEIQGEEHAFQAMKNWLQKTGSPTSRIDRATFTDATELKDYTFKKFEIRH